MDLNRADRSFGFTDKAFLRSSWSCVLLALLALSFVTTAHANSLRSIDNGPNQYEHAILTRFPAGFGTGEFTFEVWVKLDNRSSYPVGLCGAGGSPRLNWCSENTARHASNCWWCNGNFLIDGVNFGGITKGTFALQLYGGGRLRWLFGDDGAAPQFDQFWSIGNGPNSANPTLLDGQWHAVSVVRRFAASSAADLELWIDGVLIDTVRSNVRTDVGAFWAAEELSALQGNKYAGWFFMSEKQAVNIRDFVLEDYKGLIDEMRFWNRAKTATELSQSWRNAVAVGAPGLSGYYDFANASSSSVCDRVATTKCMPLVNPNPSNTAFVNSESAPVGTPPGRVCPV